MKDEMIQFVDTGFDTSFELCRRLVQAVKIPMELLIPRLLPCR